MKLTLHENQHFRKNVQRKYHMFLFFCNWRKYHIFRKTKSKENIISDIFRKKSIEQGVDKKKIDEIIKYCTTRMRVIGLH